MNAIEYGALIRRITSNVNEYVGRICSEYGITYGQFEYFILIFMNPGINQLAISRRKSVGKASVTKALKSLEHGGFISRSIDPHDRRNIRCFISENGKGIAEKLIQISPTIESNLFLGFSDNEKSLLYEYLLKLEKNSRRLPTLDT